MFKNYFELSDFNGEEQEREDELDTVDAEKLANSRPRFPSFNPSVEEVNMNEETVEIEEPEEEPLKPNDYLGRNVPKQKKHFVNVSFNIDVQDYIALVYGLRIARNVANLFDEITKGNTITTDILDVGSIEDIEEEVEILSETNGFDI